MESTRLAEHVIQDLAGCGRFQALIVTFVYIMPKIDGYFNMLFMAFGNYNPGWRCLDNTTHLESSTGNVSNLNLNHSSDFSVGSCDTFKTCGQVEYNPDISTIVTEWGLVCDQSWKVSLITSIQMAGLFFGSIAAGQLGDWYGRKMVLYTSFAGNIILNLISIFSISWQMYAVFRFFLGFSTACIFTHYFLLTSEYMTIKWRAIITPIPMFYVGGIVFVLTSMWLKDWKQVHLATVCWSVACFLPVVWVPESLRWLEVKNRRNKFKRVVTKILRTNGKELPPLESISLMPTMSEKENGQTKKPTLFDLFRKGYRLYACIIGMEWLAMSFIFYAIYLGAQSLYGDFFINLILLNAIEIPFAILPMMAPNILGRKISCCLFLIVATLCFFISVVLLLWTEGHVKSTGTLVLTLISKCCVNAAWYVFLNTTAEIYPTTVRALSVGWACLMARVGGIAAPFLFPSDRSSLYICFLVMGVISLLCCVGILKLPETKGKPLKETFDDVNEDREERRANINT